MSSKSVRMLNGYRVLYRPEHPTSMQSTNWIGYVYEHVYVAESFLGRPLKGSEVVHHLNGNRADNRYQNLLVLLRGQHSKLHAWLDKGAIYEKPYNGIEANSGKPKLDEPCFCSECGITLQGKQKLTCSVGCHSARITNESSAPTKEQLESDLRSTNNWSALGRKYGVSDNAVRKWARKYRLAGQS